MQITETKVARYGGDVEGTYIGEVLVVSVDTDFEVTGIGFVSAPKGLGEIFHNVIQNILAPAIMGEDPRHHGELWEKMFRVIPRRGGEGPCADVYVCTRLCPLGHQRQTGWCASCNTFRWLSRSNSNLCQLRPPSVS